MLIFKSPLTLSVEAGGKSMRRICTPAKVHNIYNTTNVLFVILFFLVDHDDDVPFVQVLILCLKYKGQMRFLMTKSR